MDKVMIYIVDPSLSRVVTFVQPRFPAAGRQVPAGTVENGENVHAAALRELTEETGRSPRSPLRLFATTCFDAGRFTPEIHHRTWFYVIDRAGDFPADGWRHVEHGPGDDVLAAEFQWVDIAHARDLIAGHGHLLDVALDLALADGNANTEP